APTPAGRSDSSLPFAIRTRPSGGDYSAPARQPLSGVEAQTAADELLLSAPGLPGSWRLRRPSTSQPGVNAVAHDYDRLQGNRLRRGSREEGSSQCEGPRSQL